MGLETKTRAPRKKGFSLKHQNDFGTGNRWASPTGVGTKSCGGKGVPERIVRITPSRKSTHTDRGPGGEKMGNGKGVKVGSR